MHWKKGKSFVSLAPCVIVHDEGSIGLLKPLLMLGSSEIHSELKTELEFCYLNFIVSFMFFLKSMSRTKY